MVAFSYEPSNFKSLAVPFCGGSPSRAACVSCVPGKFLSAQRDSYLVDPASSHMLVSKIKPCMSKYKLLHSETAIGSLNQLWFLRSYNDNCGNSRANSCN